MAEALTDFTLLIPTRNRPDFLERLLRYCDEAFPAMTILVADSSEGAQVTATAEVCAKPTRHNVSLRSYPSHIPFIEKVTRAVAAVSTPFMALLADDDFLLPGPLAQGLDLLRGDADIACVQGCEVFFRPATSIGKPKQMLMDFHGGKSIDQPLPSQRMHTLLGNYRASMYGLRRTREFYEDVSAIVPLQSQYMLMELAFASLDVLRGKLARLPLVLTMRESHDQVAYRQHAEVTYWERVLFALDFSKWLGVYLAIIAPRLATLESMPLEQAQETVRESLREFTRWHFRMADIRSSGGTSRYGRAKNAVFRLPLIGSLLNRVWLLVAKDWDRRRLRQNFGLAMQQNDFKALVARIENHFDYLRDKTIYR